MLILHYVIRLGESGIPYAPATITVNRPRMVLGPGGGDGVSKLVFRLESLWKSADKVTEAPSRFCPAAA